MIKSIAIENFQAYKDAFLLFDEGVNVITGS
jgi:DNA repair exonuclease SbcCD ATPase subunit